MVSEATSLPIAGELPDGFVKSTWRNIPGVFVTAEAFRDMLVGFELTIGEARLEAARAKGFLRLADEKIEKILKEAKSMEFAARWGLPLGIGAGIAAAAIIFGIVWGAVQASAPYRTLQQAIAP